MATERQIEPVMKRPDGWYSADNELIDVLAAEIGIYALGVYHLLKRRSFLGEQSISLRGIGDLLGISKNAAAGAVVRLKKVGLVEERDALGRNLPIRYVVCHAKDVLAARSSGAGLCPSGGTQLEILCPSTGTGVSLEKDTSVPVEGHQCPSGGTLFKEERIQRQKQDTTPLPPASQGEAAQPAADAITRNAGDAALRDCAAKVMRECNLSDPRLEPVILRALTAWCAKERAEPDAGAVLMIENQREFVRLGEFLRHSLGWRKFFAQGYWVDWKLWPLDQARLAQGANARTGM